MFTIDIKINNRLISKLTGTNVGITYHKTDGEYSDYSYQYNNYETGDVTKGMCCGYKRSDGILKLTSLIMDEIYKERKKREEKIPDITFNQIDI